MAILLLLLEVAAVVLVVANLSADEPISDTFWPLDVMTDVQERCDQTGFACTIASSIFFTVVPLVVGSFVFVFWRLRRVQRPLVKLARSTPAEIVDTAGEIVGNVVGRDDVCEMLIDNLRERDRRRPYVIVGGIGVGKTAALVRLTQLLAERGAVPIPIRLRDVQDNLDFLEMARDKFLRETQSSTWLAAEAERAWSRLRKIDKIVVLADGLEEAFAGAGVDQQRDHRVRAAVRQARKRGYPLVIASREHDALDALDAALLHLEPINSEAALEYVQEPRPTEDEQRLGWIIERAHVVETPLYLQMVRQLHESGQLRHTTVGPTGIQHEMLETRDADRVQLRMNLAKGWLEALVAGNLEIPAARVPLNAAQREAAILHLAALACCGLANDTLEVTFTMFESAASNRNGVSTPVFPKLREGLQAMLDEAVNKHSTDSVEVVRTETQRHRWENMQLAASNGVRLGLVESRKDGVRFPHSTMQAYLASLLIGEALKDPSFRSRFTAPGRELLIALGMFARRDAANATAADEACAELPDEAAAADGQEALKWRSWLWRRLREAAGSASTEVKKLALLTAAVEVESLDIKSGDGQALKALVNAWTEANSWDETSREAKMLAVAGVGEAARRVPEVKPRRGAVVGARAHDTSSYYLQLYRICVREDNYQIRLAAAHELGLGGQVAFNELKDTFQHDIGQFIKEADEVQAEGNERYSPTVKAWLLPMLVGSADKSDTAAKVLREWLGYVGSTMPLFLEAALAQGFKYAANRRPQHPYEMAETRGYLAARAEDMLQVAKSWYSRLTLLQALGLWALSGTLPSSRDEAEREDARAVVTRWARREDGRPEHPLVQQACELVIKALEKRDPERFLWIDESSVVTTVGSRSMRRRPHALRTLWIPPSAGWLVLDRRAQQLVADILILLTLAERGGTVDDWAGNLKRINRSELPLCLSEERCDHLEPAKQAGVTQRSPGERCKSGCHVGLCPYPPKGQQPYRVEFGEAFCRRQRELVLSGRAPWQHATRVELRKFWMEMEKRARA